TGPEPVRYIQLGSPTPPHPAPTRSLASWPPGAGILSSAPKTVSSHAIAGFSTADRRSASRGARGRLSRSRLLARDRKHEPAAVARRRRGGVAGVLGPTAHHAG